MGCEVIGNMFLTQVQGISEFGARLRGLSDKMQSGPGSPVRAGLAAAAQVIRDAARELVHFDPDGDDPHLRDRIVMALDRHPDTNEVRYVVMIAAKTRRYKNNRLNRRLGRNGKTFKDYGDFFWWVVLEFGLGHLTQSYPFMRPAFDQNVDKAIETFRTTFIEKFPDVSTGVN